MELTSKELKFLTIMNETRLSGGKLLSRYLDEVNKFFSFSNSELNAAVKKLVKMEMLSVIDIGGDERVYFHTAKVNESDLDKSLKEIKH